MLIKENVTQSKFMAFNRQIVEPFVEYLNEHAPDAEVRLAGSFIHQKTNPRPNSDVDILVFSETLKDFDPYVRCLNFLNERSKSFLTESGVASAWFTQLEHEILIVELVKYRNQVTLDEVMPAHWLFYPSKVVFFEREDPGLRERILADSIVVKHTSLPQGSQESVPPSELDMFRWDAERALADFILSDGILDEQLRKDRYSSKIHSLLRRLADRYFAPTEASVKALLPILEEMGLTDLSRSFRILSSARDNLHYDQVCDIAMMDVARKLLNI